MATHRTYSAAFKRQVAEEFVAGEALNALSKRHDISRQLIWIWVSDSKLRRWPTTFRRLTDFRNTKPGLQPWSGWSDDRPL